MKTKSSINWKHYRILLVASMLSTLAVLPYALNLQKDVLAEAPISMPVIVAGSIAQSLVLFAILIFIGLKLSSQVGLNLVPIKNTKTAIVLGLAAGLAIIAGDQLFIQWGVNLGSQVSIPAWQGFLASFYGGIGEEVLLRLFLMSLIVWGLSKLTKKPATQSNGLMWSSIVLAAILFGIGHLPATAALTTLTPLVIARALVLNGIGGVTFGWLYWKDSLLAAMVAHFSADIVIHVILPII